MVKRYCLQVDSEEESPYGPWLKASDYDACEGDRAQDQQRLFHIESALETKRAELAAELALRQTAEGYAARNALRVIELEAALREILDKGARVDGWTAQRSASMWAGEARALLAVAETKGEQG